MTIKGFLYYISKPLRVYSFFTDRGLLNWMPDGLHLKAVYRINTGNSLNLKNPQSFNEKLQWLKIHDRKPLYTIMVDKHLAKEYVAERIGRNYIIPTLGVWKTFDEIDFDALPDQFVLKCTHDSGGLVIVRDKSKLDKDKAKKIIEHALKRKFYYKYREWPYKNVVPQILAEKYMSASTNDVDVDTEGLTDYKFYCFNGVPKYLYVSKGLENHATASISFLSMDWAFAPFGRSDYKPFENLPPKPSQFEHMKELAAQLSKGIAFLRVDLYQIGEQIYFSELTFSPCAGMMPFSPQSWDLELGKLIELPQQAKEDK